MTQVTLLTLPQVQARVNLAKSQIYHMISKNLFPSPIKIGKVSRWRSDALDTWIERQSTKTTTN